MLAAKIGNNLRGGEVIELTSDLGGGKTTFTRGLVQGTGSKDVVSSPTFTISKLYNAPKFAIYHFDFYRLTEPGLIEHELNDVLNDDSIVTVLEWGSNVKSILPKKRIKINLKQTGEQSRELTIEYPQSLEYAVRNIC